eukprot:1156619-Pelagomonas_calceolata.AAC.6
MGTKRALQTGEPTQKMCDPCWCQLVQPRPSHGEKPRKDLKHFNCCYPVNHDFIIDGLLDVSCLDGFLPHVPRDDLLMVHYTTAPTDGQPLAHTTAPADGSARTLHVTVPADGSAPTFSGAS